MEKKNMTNWELPHELIVTEILVKLPIKSLVRFKAVCSEWRDAINSRHFGKLQLCYSKNQGAADMVLLKQYHPDGPSDFLAGGRIVEPPITGNEFDVFPSNGVLLLVDYPARVMKLWNPTTGKSMDIPEPSEFEVESCAFWFDPNSGGFRILAVVKTTVRVFYSDSNSWETVNIPALTNIKLAKHNAKAFIHGGFHLKDEERRIVSLSPAGEIIARFRPPPGFSPNSHSFITAVWDGRLCTKAVKYTETTQSRDFEVWTMEEYGDDSSWKLIWSLPFNFDHPHHPLLDRGRCFFCVVVSEPPFLPHDGPLSLVRNFIPLFVLLRNAGHRDLDGNTMVRILSPDQVSQIPYPLEDMTETRVIDTYTQHLLDPNP